ncbi:MAG: glycosyltransferase, partial [Paludibacter sp.]
MTPRVIVCVTNDLNTDQRVHKSCTVLINLGYEVLEYGRLLPDSFELKRDYSTHRVKHIFNKGPLFYAEFNIRLFIFLLFNRFDLVFSNDLDTLPASFLSAKIKRKPIIYDTHEYFTQTPELVKRPYVQRIWKLMEDIIFPFLSNIITVNDSIAALYQNRFNKSVKVVRNIPLTYTNKDFKNRKDLGLPLDKRIIILQGAGINVQRGAEEAIEAMQFIENAILLIIGNGDVINILKRMVEEKQLENIVIFKPKMPFTELRQYTINAD